MRQYLAEIQKILNSYRNSFPEDDEFLGFLPKQLEQNDLEICSRKNFSGHLTASALLLNKENNAAFLIHHKFLDRWLQAGGHLDPLEEPIEGARRELAEETGLTAVALHDWQSKQPYPLDIDSHLIPPNPKKNEFSHYHHDFLYVFVAAESAEKGNEDSRLQLEEVNDCKWIAFEKLESGDCGKRLARAVRKLKALL
ncbi:MAG: NUDIX hydrolase [Candidatus Obscuribacterales bacterium]|nr:NUDIX hydrolase [Candidatus Obscuribacterales bacterium]